MILWLLLGFCGGVIAYPIVSKGVQWATGSIRCKGCDKE